MYVLQNDCGGLFWYSVSRSGAVQTVRTEGSLETIEPNAKALGVLTWLGAWGRWGSSKIITQAS